MLRQEDPAAASASPATGQGGKPHGEGGDTVAGGATAAATSGSQPNTQAGTMSLGTQAKVSLSSSDEEDGSSVLAGQKTPLACQEAGRTYTAESQKVMERHHVHGMPC